MTATLQLIGNRLRKHRRLMGYSQLEVAKRLGHKDTALISRWENGITLPGTVNVMHLSRLYRTLVNELLLELDQQSVELIYPKHESRDIRPTMNAP